MHYLEYVAICILNLVTPPPNKILGIFPELKGNTIYLICKGTVVMAVPSYESAQ